MESTEPKPGEKVPAQFRPDALPAGVCARVGRHHRSHRRRRRGADRLSDPLVSNRSDPHTRSETVAPRARASQTSGIPSITEEVAGQHHISKIRV